MSNVEISKIDDRWIITYLPQNKKFEEKIIEKEDCDKKSESRKKIGKKLSIAICWLAVYLSEN